MKMDLIPLSWISLTETLRLDAAPFIALHKAVQDRGVDMHDLEAVKAVWRSIEMDFIPGKPPGPIVVDNWGAEIKAYRHKHGKRIKGVWKSMSRPAFATLAGISVMTVLRLETGVFKRPVHKERAIRRVLWGSKT